MKQKVALDQKMFEIMNMEILLNVSIVVPGKAKWQIPIKSKSPFTLVIKMLLR